MMKNPVAEAIQTALHLEPRVSARLEEAPLTSLDRECWVGIDVAKGHLDVATWPTVEHLRVTRDDAGLAELAGWLQARTPTLIVCWKRPAAWRRRWWRRWWEHGCQRR